MTTIVLQTLLQFRQMVLAQKASTARTRRNRTHTDDSRQIGADGNFVMPL